MRMGAVVLGAMLFVAGLAAGLVLTANRDAPTEPGPDGPVRSTAARPAAAAKTGNPSPAVVPTRNPRGPAGPARVDFADVAERTVAAVTNISSRQVVRQTSIFGNDPFFRYFFGDRPEVSGYRERLSLGSGVIVAPDGFILTNAHVVGRQSRGITVTLADNRDFEAELIGRDESTDIALLRIDADRLPTVPWGNSSELRIAEWVLAVGNPFELSQTVTLGIVSAVGRDNLGVARYEDFIQTDAAINPGNSGGALINAAGELVGINTAIYSDSGGYQGVGFAVPSNLARRVMQDLIEFGEVRRGALGYVDVQPVTPRLARELGAPDTKGVVVWRIDTRSAAAQAGIEPGDIIVMFDQQPIEDPSDYARLLSDAEIGSTVTLGVIRSGQRFAFDVEVSQARAR